MCATPVIRGRFGLSGGAAAAVDASSSDAIRIFIDIFSEIIFSKRCYPKPTLMAISDKVDHS
jgi:hypothetical protein